MTQRAQALRAAASQKDAASRRASGVPDFPAASRNASRISDREKPVRTEAAVPRKRK